MSFLLSSIRIPQISAKSAPCMMIIHGILGSGKNWRSFARSLSTQLEGWQIVLPDLRNHGESIGAPPPHTLLACAADLRALIDTLDNPPTVIVGHSFGGKVALELAATRPPGLRQLWVLDTPPGLSTGRTARGKSVEETMDAVRKVRLDGASRESITRQLSELGETDAVSSWMTTNLRRGPEGFTWRFEVDAAHDMLRSYWQGNFWSFIDDNPDGVDIRYVRGGRSTVWRPDAFEQLAERERNGSIRVDVLPRAAHWVQVDDPEGLTRLLSEGVSGL